MVEQTKDKNFSSQLTFQSILKMVFVSNGKHHFFALYKAFHASPLYSKSTPRFPAQGRVQNKIKVLMRMPSLPP